jgi:prepilin-type N-terminal cleavage/methylation domain-containing protein
MQDKKTHRGSCLSQAGIPRSSRRGFTLVEALFAVVLLGMAFSGGLYALSFSNRVAAAARCSTVARIAAQAEVDRLLGAIYSPPGVIPPEFTSGPDPQVRTVDLYLPTHDGGSTVQGTRTLTVQEIDPTGRPRLLRITVRVEYTYRGRPYSYEIATLRSPDI